MLNLIPDGNALAGMDDRINNYLNHIGLKSLGDSQFFKIVTIPLATVATYPAIMDRAPIHRPSDPWKRRQ